MHKLSGILLVDDDFTCAFLAERLLRKLVPADHLLVAENGAEGLRVLEQVLATTAEATPWLVLLDLNMPVLNGFEFLESYQQLPEAQRQRAAVVVLTTSLHRADLARLQELPIAGVVSKPLTEAKLDVILRQSLPTPSPPGRVFQLFYHSRASPLLTEAEVYQLLSHARQANAAADVTGLLVYRESRFVQVLEGPEAQVRAAYARIARDPRHTQIMVVGEAANRPRHFARWSMAWGHGSEPTVARLFEAALAPTAGDDDSLWEALLQDVEAALEPLPG
jgi:CheY-like chemotaxis protein